jgi:NodT family efflux transporter outer membrane factor (OMF) lipoprotein
MHAAGRGIGSAGLLAVALTTLALNGCVLKSPPDAAELKQQALPTMQVPPAWRTVAAGGAPAAAGWLASFKDEQLTAAVMEALQHNADLRTGAARVEQAQLYAKQAGARLWPSVDALARGGGKMSGDNSGLQGGVLTVAWELDVWGRVRYGRAAAAAEASAAELDFEFARQSLAASVARNWFIATEAQLQVEVARSTIRDGESLVKLAEDRARVGVGNDEEIFVARGSVASSQENLRGIELGREQAIRALEILLGRYPAGLLTTTPLPTQPDAVPGGLPSELLERRPDIVAAERRVAAAFNRIGEAKAARLPSITLTTGVSAISSELFVLKERNNPIWNAGGTLLAPLFRGGALKTQVEIRTAEQKEAVAAYAAAGLRAFADVENALSTELAAREREQLLARSLEDNRRALQVVQNQFKVGSTDLRFVTQRQLALNSVESALIRMRTEQRVQRVNLHLALGGGFEAPPPSPPPAQP